MTNIQENNTIKVSLENGLVKVNLELTGVKGAKGIARQVIEAFLDTLEGEDIKPVEEPIDVMEEMRKAYIEVGEVARIESNNPPHIIVEKPSDKGIGIGIGEQLEEDKKKKQVDEDGWVKPTENQLDKFNREFPKLQDALSRNLYSKLTELQINQQSYFVTDKGQLKLQAKYLCKCGNFKKHWVYYPSTRKTVRCSHCSKVNTLINVKGGFPSTDEHGNIFVTSNMGKKESKIGV